LQLLSTGGTGLVLELCAARLGGVGDIDRIRREEGEMQQVGILSMVPVTALSSEIVMGHAFSFTLNESSSSTTHSLYGSSPKSGRCHSLRVSCGCHGNNHRYPRHALPRESQVWLQTPFTDC